MADVLRNYLKKRNCYITCAGRLDGGGAQAHAIVSTIIAARFLGFKYVHTPMCRVAHNETNMKKEKWDKKWRTFFNLGESEMSINDFKKLPGTSSKMLNLDDIDRYSERSLGRMLKNNTLYVVKKAHGIIQKHFEHPEMQKVYQSVLTDIQMRFAKTKKPELTFYSSFNAPNPPNTQNPPKTLHIAVHSRRGDVARGSHIITKKRFKGNDYFYRVILNLERILRKLGVPYQVHLFSEGRLKFDFPELYWIDKNKLEAEFRDDHKIDNKPVQFAQPIQVHLDGDPIASLYHLSAADILVMAKSCYSYIAGMFNPNSVKLYTQFWFKPASPTWVTIEESSYFDEQQFQNELGRVLRR